MNRNTMTLRQVPSHVRMPVLLRAVLIAHVLLGFLFVSRDVAADGAFAAVPMFAAFGVAAWLFIEPGRAARIGATVLATTWAFLGLGFLVVAPILLLTLWAAPSVRAYLRYADEWRLDHVTYHVAA